MRLPRRQEEESSPESRYSACAIPDTALSFLLHRPGQHRYESPGPPALRLTAIFADIRCHGWIGNAKIEGLVEDLGMSDDQYRLCLSIFYVPYIIFGKYTGLSCLQQLTNHAYD